jgi:hypothetical protein
MTNLRRHISILALLLLSISTVAAQKEGRRSGQEKPAESAPASENTAVETVKAVYDAAVAFVTSVAMEVAKSLPADMSSDPEQVKAWEAQSRSIEELRARIAAHTTALKSVFDDSDGKEMTVVEAGQAIARMRSSLQESMQHENRKESLRDADSGFVRIYATRHDTVKQLCLELDRTASLALERLR